MQKPSTKFKKQFIYNFANLRIFQNIININFQKNINKIYYLYSPQSANYIKIYVESKTITIFEITYTNKLYNKQVFSFKDLDELYKIIFIISYECSFIW